MSEKSVEALKASTVLLLILIVSISHYGTGTEHRYLHELYQRLYYVPILLAAFWYGPQKGVLAAALASLLYLFHIQKDWAQLPLYSFNQYVEIAMYHAVALVIGFLARQDRRHREKLEKTSSELSAAYRRLQQTYERLTRTERLAALGELSAGVAHEIRNPLGSIKGSVEILAREIPADHPKHEFLRIIEEETARLNAIVAEFLKFARPPKPAVQLSSVNALIESTLTLLGKQAEDARVGVRSRLDPRLPPVLLDPDQIRQVLLNITLNAIQAMPEGGVLELTSSSSTDREWVGVEISDSGTGIAPADLERVFHPFYTTKPQGTGLGLAISHQLVNNHGGRIGARNNPAGGATFRVDLPVRPAAGSDVPGKGFLP